MRLALVGLLVGAYAPAARGADPTRPGPFAVGFTSLVEFDDSREHSSGSDRPVPVFVFYPADAADVRGAPPARYARNPFLNSTTDVFLSTHFEARGLDAAYQQPRASAAGPFPLLVLSTGARAPWWYSLGIATRVASHGFVVAQLAHWGDGAYPPLSVDPLLHAAQRGMDKPRDVSFAIDRLLDRSATRGDLLHGLIHPERIAAGGHSFGGLAAMVLAGGDDLVCDTFGALNPPVGTCVPSPPDPRIRALVLLDGSSQNMRWHELQRIRVPTIGINEDWDSTIVTSGGNEDAGPLWARQHAAIDAHPSYRVDLLRTRHVPSLTSACQSALVRGDLGLFNPAQLAAELVRLECNNPALTPYATAHAITWRYAVAFLKTHLAGEPGYQHLLTPGWALTREPDAMFFVREKRNGRTPETEFPEEPLFWFFRTQSGEGRAQAPKDFPQALPELEPESGVPE